MRVDLSQFDKKMGIFINIDLLDSLLGLYKSSQFIEDYHSFINEA